MQTSYEFLKAAKGVVARNQEAFKTLIELSASDMFFQIKFIVCDDAKTNEELINLYKYVKKNLFLVEDINLVGDWINDVVVEKTNNWLVKNRQDMFDAEKKGTYSVPTGPDTFNVGVEMEATDYTRILAGYICNLPEIHRITAVAFYYNNTDINKISELLNIDITTIKNRVAYIEKILNVWMKQYCKENGFTAASVDSQKIRAALIEIGKLYKYTFADQLYEIVVS